MISINEQFIEAAAPNGDAAKNDRTLAFKNKFVALHRSTDDTLLFGQCQGSGKEPYICSIGFTVNEAPTYRCSCPSRQFPCKHAFVLFYVLVQGKTFTSADVPANVAAKRTKAAARGEKRNEEAEKPRTINKTTLAKKINSQLAGIDLLEKRTLNLVRLGIGNMNSKSAREVAEQAKQLGNAIFPGASRPAPLLQFVLHRRRRRANDPAGEAFYSEALDQLGRLHTLVRHGRTYLNRLLENPELRRRPSRQSQPGWAMPGNCQLKDEGLLESNAELVQLAFNST